ncbi:hypothetical protein IMCC20628_00733 [Hoeflea sp. IMCC20628]|uniref:hypothetical protein n=1 Tax=Hoeflea sp. IMCC20628 TaxID=1620421 RepID=UPI00063AED88|nr:hypothetical protein [Hoeflea sp. IMCC20628]AKH99457.1 hypothetical protein IMCC20628_00733 [Hoeflea sp. IMCC20628]
MTMLPDDDFLLYKSARRESVTILRIALMALMGCLLLLSVLVMQARAQPDAGLHQPVPAAHKIQPAKHPLQTFRPDAASPVNPAC